MQAWTITIYLVLAVFLFPGWHRHAESIAHELQQTTKSCPPDSHGRAPRYFVAWRLESDLNPGASLWASVSTDETNFEPDKLLLLACKFSADFKAREVVQVNVFDSRRAAKAFANHEHGFRKGAEKYPRAFYVFSPAGGQHFIEWRAKRKTDWEPEPNGGRTRWINVILPQGPDMPRSEPKPSSMR